MYTTLLAFSFCIKPPSMDNHLRTLSTVVLFAIGAVVGWPFSLLLALPFVLEELFVFGADRVVPATYVSWLSGRIRRLITSGVIASLIFVRRHAFAIVLSTLIVSRIGSSHYYRLVGIWKDSRRPLEYYSLQHLRRFRAWARIVRH